MIRQSVEEGQPCVNKGWSYTRSRDGALKKPTPTRSGMVDAQKPSWAGVREA